MIKLERESLLLEVARELILESGMVSFTFTDIAKRAEVSRATLYKYFSGKEDVLVSLFVRDANNTRQMLLDIQDYEPLNDREKLITALLAPVSISSDSKNRLGITFLSANPGIYLFAGKSQQEELERLIEQLKNIHTQFWMTPMKKGTLITTQEQLVKVMAAVYPYQRGCVLIPQSIMTLGNHINRSLFDVYENLMLYTDKLEWHEDHKTVEYDKVLKAIGKFERDCMIAC
ncbi:TetR/AcrR family transcriptional regulator [Shewanella sp. D64]|uniref:TetR/AcrR family transcriptional regulator n=1 Tax=unclassified Shewanella TaxID=196818 RepID=UPI0022BA5E03|nr:MULTISPECIES: TetR/AcrR family transcriptional regulator [unclassified Shewanella]MEC4726819.1 TetR/AcrR family transcriptional regulator [Shewanella sp. D64]MEC4739069.1 TetR/AcrR family transcriptional regulator [Shewanella sp. E94]WBJ95925.1 TetR/AcrR family transcriptional regulator [Shewanella sp. MTB7]